MAKKLFSVRLDPKLQAAAKAASALENPPRTLEQFIGDAMKAALPLAFRKGLK